MYSDVCFQASVLNGWISNTCLEDGNLKPNKNGRGLKQQRDSTISLQSNWGPVHDMHPPNRCIDFVWIDSQGTWLISGDWLWLSLLACFAPPNNIVTTSSYLYLSYAYSTHIYHWFPMTSAQNWLATKPAKKKRKKTPKRLSARWWWSGPSISTPAGFLTVWGWLAFIGVLVGGFNHPIWEKKTKKHGKIFPPKKVNITKKHIWNHHLA